MFRHLLLTLFSLTCIVSPGCDDPIAHQSGTVSLQRRTKSEYGQSAYSFRYRTQEKSRHKNHVDVVYSASGKLRVNNHGGMISRIADLGVRDQPLSKQIGDVTNWTTTSVQPVAGHSYALDIGRLEKMTVVFHVTDVTEEELTLEWNPNDYEEWSADITRLRVEGLSTLDNVGSKP